MMDAGRAVSPCRSFVTVMAFACAACSTLGDKQPDAAARSSKPAGEVPLTRAELDFRRGVRSYDEAEYELASRHFQSALDLGLRARRDQANAYKYLAFMACSSGKAKACKTDFRKALEVDPKFDLAPAEAGHPIWGPVFRSVKDERTTKGKPR